MTTPINFEERLKQSAFFADVMNTHRTATAQILAAFIGPLVKNNQIAVEDVVGILKQLEEGTGKPSLDGERRHAVSVLREALQALD
jgi:hypothetical protein